MAPPSKLVKRPRPRPDHLDLLHPKKRKPVFLVETANGFVLEPPTARSNTLRPAIAKDLDALSVSEQIPETIPSTAEATARRPRTYVEKLLSSGVRLGFLKEHGTRSQPRVIAQGYPVGQRYDPKRETTTIRKLESEFDAAFHLESYGGLSIEALDQGQHDSRDDSFAAVQLASRRLQGIMEVRNARPFIPAGLLSRTPVAQNSQPKARHQAKLWKYLQEACRQKGFRRLRLESATFRDEQQPLNLDWAMHGQQRTQQQRPKQKRRGRGPGTLLTVTSSEAHMELYEIPVRDEFGCTRQWLVFKISAPDAQQSSQIRAPLTSSPEAWMVFACPVTQVMKLHETTEALTATKLDKRNTRAQTRAQTIARLVDSEQFQVTVYNPMVGTQLSLAFLFSKNGVPSFECSQSSRGMSGQGKPIQTPGKSVTMCCHDCSDTRRGAASPWQNVKDAMARFGCIMEVKAKPETTWTEVGPAVAEMKTLRPNLPVQNSLSTGIGENVQPKAIHRASLALRSRKSGWTGD